jgi:hypothetical protein
MAISAPTDEDSGETSFANLDGLAAQPSLSLTFERVWGPALTAASAAVDGINAICEFYRLKSESEQAECVNSDGELQGLMRENGFTQDEIDEALDKWADYFFLTRTATTRSHGQSQRPWRE